MKEPSNENLSHARQSAAHSPTDAEAYCRLGNAMQEQGRLDEAIAAFRTALILKPAFPEAHYNLANALSDTGRIEDAIGAYQSGLKLRPIFPDAYNNLGNCLHRQWRVDEAIAAFRKAIVCRPSDPATYNNLGNALKDSGQIDQAVKSFERAMALDPQCAIWASHRLYAMHFHPAVDAATLLRAHLEWDERFARPLKQTQQPHGNDRRPDRRLKVGYVSPNFREHVVGRNLLPLLREHDHERFEIFCFSNSPHEDALTTQFQAHADSWRNISKLSDDAAAQEIRADGIDILVDLSLHMGGNRLLLFARKPAPVQVTFAGYPSGTGLKAIDFRLTDPWLDPPGQSDCDYREQSVRLPHSFWCFDPTGNEPEVGPPPFEKNGGRITFGCFNNFSKVNDRALFLWGNVLRAVPDSRLLILAPPGGPRERTGEAFRQAGVEESRVEFVDRQPRDRYLKLYHRIDVALDTLPYNGHTTSLEGLWMGVPVVTCVGQTAVGRAGLSQLANLGLTDLAASDEQELVKVTTDLAADTTRLGALRRGLRGRMRRSPLTDARPFARAVESAYQAIWRK